MRWDARGLVPRVFGALAVVILLGAIGYALASFSTAPTGQKTWYWQNPYPQGNTLLRVAAGTSDLWAVGGPGIVLFSTDGGVVWDAQDPNTANTLRAVDFVDDQTGWVVGDNGTIRKTIDAGSTWTTQTGVPATRDVRGVSMVDASTGWLVGELGVIRKTVNGGDNWVTQTNNTVQLYDVSAVDANHAWAVGATADGSSTVRATSNGSLWTTQTVPTTATLAAVCFVDVNNGYAVGQAVNGVGQIIKTTDGGSTWTTVSAGNTENLTDVEFVTPSVGWIAESRANGTVGAIRYTTDGGATWSLQMSGVRGIYGLAVLNGSTAAAVGYTGTMLRTEDAGLTWISQAGGTTRTLYGVSLVDSSTGYAVGQTGLVMRTEDGGDTWNSSTAGASNWLTVSFADPQTGWIAGPGGALRKTTDGAGTWAIQSSNTTQQINSVAAITTQTAFAVGNLGTIRKTVDGGSTWTTETSGITSSLQDVFFVDANTGWAVGNTGRVRKTTDGGTTWVAQTTGVTSTLYSVHFADALNGWVVGAGGVIRNTTDGGSTWTAQTSGVSEVLYSVVFSDASHGWAVGGVAGSPARIVRTTDGGATWTAQNANMTGILRAVGRANGATGLAVGAAGSIRRTTDGGATWVPQTYGTFNTLFDLAFTDVSNGWSVGNAGTIMRTRDGGASWAALVSGTTSNLFGIDMRSSTLGWVVGAAGTVRKTVDGSNWTAQSSGTTLPLQAVDFVDDNNGWAVGSQANIRYTANGGSTWTTQTSGLTTTTPLYGVAFVDTQNGWAWGGASGVPGLLLHTIDGGATWNEQTVDVAPGVVLRAGSFIDAATGWVAGTSGVIKKTEDGGSTWTTQTVGSTAAIYGLKFIDSLVGVHVGGAGGTNMSIIRRTVDGGSTWTTQTPGTFNVLYSVDFADAGNAWISGANGTILKTTDPDAPITSVSVSPEPEDGTNGWYVTTPTVTLTVNEPSITYYSWVSPTGPWSTYSMPLERSTFGTSTLSYYSIDPGGNKGTVQSSVLRFDPVAPAAPGTPTASPSSTSTVEVSWPSVVDTVSGVGYYEVLVDGSVVGTSAVTSATVSGLSTETAYAFSVIAVDEAGNVSVASPQVTAITLAPLPRPSVAVYARSIAARGVFVDWGESTGTIPPATYRVWRSVGGAPFSVLATVAAELPRSYHDTSAPLFEPLEYRVSVLDARGEGAPSDPTVLTSTEATVLPAPVNIRATNTNSVLVTWTPSPLPTVAGYHVYRSGTSTATAETQTVAPVVSASYHDTSTAEYSEYWYRVATVDTSGNVGVPSPPVYIRTEASGTVAPPHGAYTEDTDFCALCHRAHTSASDQTLQQLPGFEASPTRSALLVGSAIDAPLCFSCHDGTSASDIMTEYSDESRTARHDVPMTGEGLVCASCHAVHSAAATDTVSGLISSGGEKSGNPFCYSCHGATAGTKPRGDLRGFEGSSHSTAVAEPPTGTKVVCLSCHVSHSSREAALYPYTADDRCLGCHTTGVFADTKTDIAARLAGPGSDTRHDLLAADSVATGSRLGCANCHEPHTASATEPCVDPDDPSTTGGMSAVGDALCLRCHDADLPTSIQTSGWAAAPLGSGGATYTVNIASSWETTSVHGAGASVSPNLRVDMGYSAGDTLVCGDCHDSHGSPNRYTLLDEVRGKAGTPTVSAVLVVPVGAAGADFRFFCASCHDLTAANHPGPGLGGADLTVFPLDCTSCHAHAGNGL